jgi:UDP-3-O-[3-hydroxymyristoyl] glucosamine N-acyltransferase
MPGSIISGNCKIGDSVYLGSNSSVREKTKITDDIIVGLNSGVVKNITESGTYVGVPAKRIK